MVKTLVVSIFIGVILSLLSYQSFIERRNINDTRFCSLITEQVNTKIQNLGEATKKDILVTLHLTPARYEKLRLTAITDIQSLAAISPCTVKYKIPPDPLGGS